jgi:hypothetical protein
VGGALGHDVRAEDSDDLDMEVECDPRLGQLCYSAPLLFCRSFCTLLLELRT